MRTGARVSWFGRSTVLVLAALTLVTGWARPALAVTDATCTVRKPLTVKPAFFVIPTRFQSEAGGTVVCIGVINDQVLAGAADLTFNGVLFTSPCRSGGIDFTGAGVLTLTAQTLPFGSITVSGGFAFTPAGGGAYALVGSISGSVLGGSVIFSAQSPPTCDANWPGTVTGELVLADA